MLAIVTATFWGGAFSPKAHDALCAFDVLYLSIMPTTNGSHEKTLAALGVTQPEQLTPVFAEIRARFDVESSAVRDEASLKPFRDAWLGRKSGRGFHIYP